MENISLSTTAILLLLSTLSFRDCDAIDKLISMCCDWNGNYRENIVPHPFNCLYFYQCEPKQLADGTILYSPTLKECPLGEDGNSLYFDIKSCKCLRRNEITCYDFDNSEHYNGFYNCSTLVYHDGRTVTC